MKELWTPDDFAEIEEIKNLTKDNENGLRIYCTQYPESFRVQIRTFKPITGHREGKRRNMMANITLTRKQLHEICEFADNYDLVDDNT